MRRSVRIETGKALESLESLNMPALQIRLFGPPSILIDGQPMPRLKTRKGLWLLALLSLRANRDVDRNWLAGTLWPDADESTSLTSISAARS
jgi:DNA-binding SARP family transcriptional activator